MALELNNYKVLSVLGTGSYGTCYKVVNIRANEVFAWKAIDYGKIPEEKKQLIVSEVNLLSELCHPNIVQYYGRIINKETTTLYILMECCDGGDLASLIKNCKKDNNLLDEGFIWRVLYQTGRALQACHSHLSTRTVLHRDIKPANVFLDVEGNVKLGDFGLARILESGSSLAQSIVGTPYYMSPEVIMDEKYNHKSDIWSLGCLIYELCSLTPPFYGVHTKELVTNIKKGKYSRIPSYYSDELQNIISYLLTMKQEARPSIEVILHHPTVVTNLVNNTLASQICHTKEKSSIQQSNSKSTSKNTSNNGTIKKTNPKDFRGKDQEDLQSKYEALKHRESMLREKLLALEERERQLEKREKELTLMDRIVKEKMARADVYLHQCRDSRSVMSVGKTSARRYSVVEPTLSNMDSSFSADSGGYSPLVPTSRKLDPSTIARPKHFTSKIERDRHVHFNTLPNRHLVSALKPPSKSVMVGNSMIKIKAKTPLSTINENYQFDETVEQNYQNCILANLTNNKKDIKHNITTSDQAIWLENKRHAYKTNHSELLQDGAINKENTEIYPRAKIALSKKSEKSSISVASYYTKSSSGLGHFR